MQAKGVWPHGPKSLHQQMLNAVQAAGKPPALQMEMDDGSLEHPCKAKPGLSHWLKTRCCWFHSFPTSFSYFSLAVEAVSPTRVVSLPLLHPRRPAVPLLVMLLYLFTRMYFTTRRVGLAAGGFLDCVGLLFSL